MTDQVIISKTSSSFAQQASVNSWLEKVGNLASSSMGNFVILTEKIKKYIRGICHTGVKFGQTVTGGKF